MRNKEKSVLGPGGPNERCSNVLVLACHHREQQSQSRQAKPRHVEVSELAQQGTEFRLGWHTFLRLTLHQLDEVPAKPGVPREYVVEPASWCVRDWLTTHHPRSFLSTISAMLNQSIPHDMMCVDSFWSRSSAAEPHVVDNPTFVDVCLLRVSTPSVDLSCSTPMREEC